MPFAAKFFLISVAIILIVDAVIWIMGKQTITQWHIEKTKDGSKTGRALLFGWGALIGHLFL